MPFAVGKLIWCTKAGLFAILLGLGDIFYHMNFNPQTPGNPGLIYYNSRPLVCFTQVIDSKAFAPTTHTYAYTYT